MILLQIINCTVCDNTSKAVYLHWYTSRVYNECINLNTQTVCLSVGISFFKFNQFVHIISYVNVSIHLASSQYNISSPWWPQPINFCPVLRQDVTETTSFPRGDFFRAVKLIKTWLLLCTPKKLTSDTERLLNDTSASLAQTLYRRAAQVWGETWIMVGDEGTLGTLARVG